MSDISKPPPPPLNARAARPAAVRLRGSAVKIVLAAAALTLSGAFTYAFILRPAAGAEAASRREADRPSGPVRPAESITRRPGSYDKLAALPEPRTQAPGPDQAAAPIAPVAYAPPPQPAGPPAGPSPAEEARGSALFFAGRATRGAPVPPPPAPEPGAGGSARADYAAAYSRHGLIAPLSPYEVKAGTLIPAALLTAVDTGRPGPVLAVTVQPVFDTVTGRTLLIPQGSRLIGEQAGDSAYGEKRAFVAWKRLILPSGKSLLLEDEAGADASGATGLPGRADRRLLQLGGAVILSGAITSLGEIARGGRARRRDSFLEALGDATTAQAVDIGGRLVDRELEVQPKIRVEPGAAVQVFVTKDLVLEPAR